MFFKNLLWCKCLLVLCHVRGAFHCVGRKDGKFSDYVWILAHRVTYLEEPSAAQIGGSQSG